MPVVLARTIVSCLRLRAPSRVSVDGTVTRGAPDA